MDINRSKDIVRTLDSLLTGLDHTLRQIEAANEIVVETTCTMLIKTEIASKPLTKNDMYRSTSFAAN